VSQYHSIRTLYDLYHIASLIDSEIKVLQTRKSLREHIKARATTTLPTSAVSNTSIFTAPKLYTTTPRTFISIRILPTIIEPAIKRESTPSSTLTCFNCFQTGYIACNCPVPKHITDIKKLEEDNKLAEADTDNIPGNEDT
jgi:hypothetical protein